MNMVHSPERKPRDRKAQRPGRVARWLSLGAFHCFFVLLIAFASAAIFSSKMALSAARWGWEQGNLLENIGPGIALHLGLCALAWGAIWWSYRRFKAFARRARAPREALKLKRLTVGTVLTETLIVLPLALVLTFGIAQLTLINIAATLADLAVIQAARSAWLWLPEASERRFGVDRPLVLEKSRVQAAAILTPVASSNYGSFAKGSRTGYANTFLKTMGAIYGTQLDGGGGNDIGSYSTAQAELHLGDGEQIKASEFSLSRHFDSDDFRTRTARKFYNSWLYTDVEFAETNERAGVRMTYNYLCLMPLVAGVFGKFKQVNGEEGYFVTLEREYTLQKQVKANARLPLN